MRALFLTLAVTATVVAASVVPTPSTPKALELFFLETFDEDDAFGSGKWVLSNSEKYRDQPVMVKPLSSSPPDFTEDKAIQLTQEMKHYGFGSKFPVPFDSSEQDLVVQFEVKFEEGLTCGGAYIKLLRAPSNGDELLLEDLTNDTPYSVMFGPDKCGNNGKLHFIVQHQSPLTQEWEEKHLNTTQPIKTDKNTHLYTMHISNSDDSFQLFIDRKSVKRGNLHTHMNPPINPPREIDDPSDKKPADWIDEEKIADEAAVKPDDWDEDAPRKIPDEHAVKPDDWEEDAPLQIPDPEAVKPSDWDDEEDGEWESPLIPNPQCSKVGCGKWLPPLINNPSFKGKWKPPLIDNPAYKGQWAPRKIPNPVYFYDARPSKSIAPILALAVEVWTTSAGIAFDNFLVANSLPAAQSFAERTFTMKHAAETAESDKKKQTEKDSESERARSEAFESGSIKEIARFYMQQLGGYIQQNPKSLYATAIAIAVSLILLMLAGRKRETPKETATSATDDTPATADSGAAANTSAAAESKIDRTDAD